MSSVTGESRALVEMFLADRRLNVRGPVSDLPAPTMEALLVLDLEMTVIKEGASGE